MSEAKESLLTSPTYALKASQYKVSLPAADIRVYDSAPPPEPSPNATSAAPTANQNTTVLLLHGNSACSLIFRPVFASPLAQTHRLLAFDLPGHGLSSDVKEGDGADPEAVYTMIGYAQVALQVLKQVGLEEVVIVGWSLGGHVGLEMIELCRRGQGDVNIRGLLITGTPPVPLAQVQLGFYPSEHRSAAATEHLTDEDVDVYAHDMVLHSYEDWMRDAVARTDGRCRGIMFSKFVNGTGCTDQKEIAERLTREGKTTLAVVNGLQEPYIDIRWVREGVEWGKGLWRGECVVMEDAGHTIFWEQWDAFWPLLKDFVADAEGGG